MRRPTGKFATSRSDQARLNHAQDGPEHVVLRSGELGVDLRETHLHVALVQAWI